MSEQANTHMLIETCLQLGQRVGKLEAALKVIAVRAKTFEDYGDYASSVALAAAIHDTAIATLEGKDE
jgi:hypothetical protein